MSYKLWAKGFNLQHHSGRARAISDDCPAPEFDVILGACLGGGLKAADFHCQLCTVHNIILKQCFVCCTLTCCKDHLIHKLNNLSPITNLYWTVSKSSICKGNTVSLCIMSAVCYGVSYLLLDNILGKLKLQTHPIF